MKTSIYTNPEFMLGFGEDLVCIHAEVKITESRDAEDLTKFEVEVLKAQLCPGEQFAQWLVQLMSLEQMDKVSNRIRENLSSEIQASAHSYFYSGEIQT